MYVKYNRNIEKNTKIKLKKNHYKINFTKNI